MKRGAVEVVLVTLIVFVGVLILLAIIYREYFVLGKDSFDKQTCQSSIMLTTSVKKGVDAISPWCIQPIKNFVPLACPRKFITVEAGTVVDDSDRGFLNKKKKLTRLYDKVCPSGEDGCLAENVFAEEMANCWDIFFRGEVPVFQQLESQLSSWFSKDEGDAGCFVCAEITLNQGEDVNNFVSYLKEKRYKDGTYYDFLAKNRKAYCNEHLAEKADTCWEAMGQDIDYNLFTSYLFWETDYNWKGLDQNEIKDGETYAVTFVRLGMDECPESTQKKKSAKRPTQTVQLIPAKQIGEYCDAVIV